VSFDDWTMSSPMCRSLNCDNYGYKIALGKTYRKMSWIKINSSMHWDWWNWYGGASWSSWLKPRTTGGTKASSGSAF